MKSRSLPQFFIGSFSELPEVPPRVDFLRLRYLDVVLGDNSQLDLVDGVAIPHINDFEGSPDDILALLGRELRVPLIGNECQPEVFGKPSDNVIFLDECAEEIHIAKNTLLSFEPSNHCVVVVGVHIISLVVGDVGQVVHQLLHTVTIVIALELGLLNEVFQFSSHLLEICILSWSHDQSVLINDFEAGNILVL